MARRGTAGDDQGWARTHLADHPGPVPVRAEELSDGRFVEREPTDAARPKVSRDAGAHTKPACQKAGPGGRADGGRGMKVCEAETVFRELVEVWRQTKSFGRGPVRPQVAPAPILR